MANILALQLYLERLVLRSPLSEQERQALLELPTSAVQVAAYEDFGKLGKKADFIYLVASGVVSRFSQAADGRRQVVAIHLPGDMANMHTLLISGCWGLQALTPVIIARVPQNALMDVVRAHPAVAIALWRDCEIDACIQSQWLVNMGTRSAKSRIAHFICEMRLRQHSSLDLENMTFELPITQGHLGEILGLTSVHVNRQLKVLREAGTACLSRGIITIANWTKLKKEADFDATYLHMTSRPTGF